MRYSVDSWEEVVAGKTSADGRFTGPCQIARKWTPLEVSIVSVPADATVGVGEPTTRSRRRPRTFLFMKSRSRSTKIFIIEEAKQP